MKRSGDRGIHRVHVQVPSGPEPLHRDILVEEHPLAGDYPGTSWAGFVDQRGLLAGAVDGVADCPTLIELFRR